MGTLYCSPANVLASISVDAQARLATDPAAAVPFAVKGDGVTLTFDSPFAYSTAITTLINGVATANTLVSAAGADGRDRVTFASAPALNAVITGQANLGAVNIDNLLAVIQDASDDMAGYFSRYGTLTADGLAIVRPRAVFMVRWKLRQRRSMEEWDPIRDDFKRLQSWLEKVAKGDIPLPATTPIATAPPPTPSAVAYTEPSVFDSPNSDPFGGAVVLP